MLTSHVLDTVRGKPAAGVMVQLLREECGRESLLAEIATDEDGRIKSFGKTFVWSSGRYRLRFGLADYFKRFGLTSIFPYAEVTVDMELPGRYHIPLIITPYAYQTYRGS